MLRSLKMFCRVLGISVCVGAIVFGGITYKGNMMSKADKDKENSKTACTYGIEVVGNYKNTVFKSTEHGALKDIKTAEAIKNVLSDSSYLGKSYLPTVKNPKGYSWKVGYTRTNKSVKPTDFMAKSKGGQDHKYADNVDMLFFLGHGFSKTTAAEYTKGARNQVGLSLNTGASGYDANTAYRKDMRLGNTDLEWLVTFTCNFLTGSEDGASGYGQVACGLRGIAGFASQQYISKDAIKTFGEYARKMPVSRAWFNYALSGNKGRKDRVTNSAHVAAYFCHKSTKNDYLWGYGKQASKDPKPYSEDPSGYKLYTFQLFDDAKSKQIEGRFDDK